MTKCNYCGLENELPVGYNRNFCDSCVSDKEIGIPSYVSMEFLPGYGRVESSRLKEMERRVIIDNKSDPTGYHVGRLGENGKIQERQPTY